jgi:hypothetical protein
MGSRPSAPTTEIIQEKQPPFFTGTGYSRGFQKGQAMYANQLFADANKASADYFANLNLNRDPDKQFTPTVFNTFDYTQLLPSDEELAKQYDERIEKEKRQKARRDEKGDKREEDRKNYADMIAVSQANTNRMMRGG